MLFDKRYVSGNDHLGDVFAVVKRICADGGDTHGNRIFAASSLGEVNELVGLMCNLVDFAQHAVKRRVIRVVFAYDDVFEIAASVKHCGAESADVGRQSDIGKIAAGSEHAFAYRNDGRVGTCVDKRDLGKIAAASERFVADGADACRNDEFGKIRFGIKRSSGYFRYVVGENKRAFAVLRIVRERHSAAGQIFVQYAVFGLIFGVGDVFDDVNIYIKKITRSVKRRTGGIAAFDAQLDIGDRVGDSYLNKLGAAVERTAFNRGYGQSLICSGNGDRVDIIDTFALRYRICGAAGDEVECEYIYPVSIKRDVVVIVPCDYRRAVVGRIAYTGAPGFGVPAGKCLGRIVAFGSGQRVVAAECHVDAGLVKRSAVVDVERDGIDVSVPVSDDNDIAFVAEHGAGQHSLVVQIPAVEIVSHAADGVKFQRVAHYGILHGIGFFSAGAKVINHFVRFDGEFDPFGLRIAAEIFYGNGSFFLFKFESILVDVLVGKHFLSVHHDRIAGGAEHAVPHQFAIGIMEGLAERAFADIYRFGIVGVAYQIAADGFYRCVVGISGSRILFFRQSVLGAVYGNFHIAYFKHI